MIVVGWLSVMARLRWRAYFTLSPSSARVFSYQCSMREGFFLVLNFGRALGGFYGGAELGLSVPWGGREAALSGLWTPFVRCGRAGAGVVEEELLGVAAVWAEVLAGEGGQFFRRDVCLLFKV